MTAMFAVAALPCRPLGTADNELGSLETGQSAIGPDPAAGPRVNERPVSGNGLGVSNDRVGSSCLPKG